MEALVSRKITALAVAAAGLIMLGGVALTAEASPLPPKPPVDPTVTIPVEPTDKPTDEPTKPPVDPTKRSG